MERLSKTALDLLNMFLKQKMVNNDNVQQLESIEREYGFLLINARKLYPNKYDYSLIKGDYSSEKNDLKNNKPKCEGGRGGFEKAYFAYYSKLKDDIERLYKFLEIEEKIID